MKERKWKSLVGKIDLFDFKEVASSGRAHTTFNLIACITSKDGLVSRWKDLGV